MTTLGLEEALAAYERARHRLPQMPSVADRCEHAATLADLAARFDVFLLDGFGVLNVGDRPIPGAAARIEALRAAGKAALVLTNAASQPACGLVAKYMRLGFNFRSEEIISSRSVAMAAIAERAERYWGVMLPSDAAIQDLPTGHRGVILGSDPAAYREAEGFLLLGASGWSENQQAMLEDALCVRPRAVLVGNPDIVAPRETGLTTEPGCFAHRLADRTGVEPMFHGKPFPGIFEAARARLGSRWTPGRVLMVGDSLHTDILGARGFGIASALVSDFGLFAGKPLQQYVDSTGIAPDFVVRCP